MTNANTFPSWTLNEEIASTLRRISELVFENGSIQDCSRQRYGKMIGADNERECFPLADA
jgi:hypothetical protein